MGKNNTCKAVPNRGIAGKLRASCSKCGAIFDDNVKGKGSCPNCHRRIKPSQFSNEFVR